MRLIILLSPLVILIHCATRALDPQSVCRVNEWTPLGYKEGMLGEPLSVFEKHKSQCSKREVELFQKRYLFARNKGLEKYCTPSVGYREGRDGEFYHEVCPAQLRKNFLEAYSVGKRLYMIEEDLKKAKRKVRDIENIVLLEKNIERRQKLVSSLSYAKKNRDVLELKLIKESNQPLFK